MMVFHLFKKKKKAEKPLLSTKDWREILKYIRVCVCVCTHAGGGGRGRGRVGSQVALLVKNQTSDAGDIRDGFRSLRREDPLEAGMATQTSIVAWRIPWTEEPHGQRVGHD